MRTIVLLIASWAAGLAAYAGALVAVRGEVLSLDTWRIIGSVTLVAWLVAAGVVLLPVLRLLAARRSGCRRAGVLPVVGAGLAIVPVWLVIGLWYGWRPTNLLIGEAGFLGLHYVVSGALLGLRLIPPGARRVPPATTPEA